MLLGNGNALLPFAAVPGTISTPGSSSVLASVVSFRSCLVSCSTRMSSRPDSIHHLYDGARKTTVTDEQERPAGEAVRGVSDPRADGCLSEYGATESVRDAPQNRHERRSW